MPYSEKNETAICDAIREEDNEPCKNAIEGSKRWARTPGKKKENWAIIEIEHPGDDDQNQLLYFCGDHSGRFNL